MDPKTKNNLINFLVKDILNVPVDSDILIYKNGKFYVGDKQLPFVDTQDIISGAQALKQLYVWQLLIKEMKRVGFDLIGNNSKDWDDVVFGKAMLYVIDVLEKKIDNLSKIKVGKVDK